MEPEEHRDRHGEGVREGGDKDSQRGRGIALRRHTETETQEGD